MVSDMIYSNLTLLSMLTAKKPLNQVQENTHGFVCKLTNSRFCNFHKAFSAKEKWLHFFNTGFYYWQISMASFTLQRFSQFSSQKHSCQSKICLRGTGFHSTVMLSKLPLYNCLYWGDFWCSFTKPGAAFCSLL